MKEKPMPNNLDADRLATANKFIGHDADGLRKACLEIPISINWLAGKFADFAASETADLESRL